MDMYVSNACVCTRAMHAYNSLKMYMYMCTYLTSQCAHDIMAVTDCIMCTCSCEVHVHVYSLHVYMYILCTCTCIYMYILGTVKARCCGSTSSSVWGFLYKVHPHWAPFTRVLRHNTYAIQLLIGCDYGHYL